MDLNGQHLLRVVQDQGGHLVVEQLQPESSNPAVFIVLLCVIIVGISAWQRRWLAALGAVVVCGILFFAFQRGASVPEAYHVEVDPEQRLVTATAAHNGQTSRTETLRAADLASADMAYSNAGGWVQLVGKDGKIYYPLGNMPYQNEPVQMLVVNRIRALIGTAPRPSI